MTIENRLIARRVGACAMTALLAGVAFAEVVADPPRLSFSSPNQTQTLKLSDGGTPLAAKEITGWKFLAGESNYARMMTFTPLEGGFSLKPTDAVEVGSYDLRIETTRGVVLVPVATPLNDELDVVQEAGWTTEEQRRQVEVKMGVASRGVREDVSFELPASYIEGQTLVLEMAGRDGHMYTWSVNGQTVAEGAEESTLRYTFPKPGEYVINYSETATDGNRSYTVAKAEAQTTALAATPTQVQATVGKALLFRQPKGYAAFAWKVDGKEMEEKGDLTHTFTTPGAHTVEYRASDPSEGPKTGFLRSVFEVTVTAK